MWARAVWEENGREIEDVLPRCWMSQRKKIVWWPNPDTSRNVPKLLKQMAAPEKDWISFPLIKIKYTSGKQRPCNTGSFNVFCI